MGRTVSNAPGYAPDDEFDPRVDDFVSKDRSYLHFDLPLRDTERENFAVSERDILGNSFWPLIGYTAEERRARKDVNGQLVFSKKERPIKFGSHRDAAILEYYGKSLSIDFEDFLGASAFSTSILAYRSKIGNNIDHSKSIFDEIKMRGNCTAIAMDIKGFFDNIDHATLQRGIIKVRKVSRLEDVDFKIFSRMTRFEWVESDDLESRLGKRYGRFGRICYPRDFRDLVRGLKPSAVNRNQQAFGIPQGTPISGLYANISMFEFDDAATKFAASLGGSYRRYSDDIAFVIPSGIDPQNFVSSVTDMVEHANLKVSANKTEISQFCRTPSDFFADRPFQYLGFTYDGRKTLIRQSSLNRYYSKMSRGVRSKIRAARHKKVARDEIYMRELFRRYTHFGQNKNFPRYAYRAAAVHGAPEIRAQLRRHMIIFQKIVSNAVDSIY